jgi:hypothetical protein
MANAREVFERLIAEQPAKFKLAQPAGQAIVIGGGRPVDEAEEAKQDGGHDPSSTPRNRL